MANETYGGGASTYDSRYDSYETSAARAEAGQEARDDAAYSSRSAGAQVFIWLAWAAAFGFWAFTMSSFFGIFRELSQGAPGGIGAGGADAGGVGYMLMSVVGGVFVLGAALAWGTSQWASRDKRLDPVTEASTAAIYDQVDASGGDDMVSRSPDARKAEERDLYRPA